MRKDRGEAARSVRDMCDACAAHGDRAAVGVDAKFIRRAAALPKMRPTSPLLPEKNAAARLSHDRPAERILVGLRWHAEEVVLITWFPDEPAGKEDGKRHQ